MSADLILWNSIARRRRSPSDTFLENGLGMLKTYIENRGYSIEGVDCARNSLCEKITPKTLSKINRFFCSILLSVSKTKNGMNKLLSTIIFPLFTLSQYLTSAIQNRRMEKMLREFALYLRDSNCQLLGIKTWYGDAYIVTKSLINHLKTVAPNILVIAGGPHSSIYREVLLRDGGFDVAVVGEGEQTLVAILDLARKTTTKKELLSRITQEASSGRLNNIIYRNNGSIVSSVRARTDANTKVIPSYDTIEEKTLIHVVVDSLGCSWGKCNFCVHSCIYPEYSPRNPRSVVEEIEEKVSQGIGIFRLAGSSSKLTHIRKIARLLEEKNIKIIYSMFVRSESHTSDPEKYNQIVESYRHLLRTGLRAVFIGAEAADDRILDTVMNKGQTVTDITQTVNAMKEASAAENIHLDIGLSLIYPAPSMESISHEELKAANIRIVEKTAPDSVLINPPAPFPNTSWYSDNSRFGFTFGENFVREMLSYDYVLYKPPVLWPDISVTLDGKSFRQVLVECHNFRRALEERGFVTEVTDEHFLMLRAAEYTGKDGVREFKHEALLDLLSGDYRWIHDLEEKVNRASTAQSLLNVR